MTSSCRADKRTGLYTPVHVVRTIPAFAPRDMSAQCPRHVPPVAITEVSSRRTPGKEFALTPQRADDISARDAAEGYNQATGVATINHANDMPIATMRDGTTRRGQDVTATTQRRGQDVTDKLRREVATRAAKRRSSASLSPSAYQMLFGVAADPDKPGELKRQIEGRGWAQTPDDGTLTHIRTAVSNTLDDVKGRWDRKE